MKQHLNLDFVDKNPFSARSISPLGFVMLMAGLLLLGLISQKYQAKEMEYANKQAALAQGQPMKKQVVLDVAPTPVSAETLMQVNETVSDLITPWGALLTALEDNQSADIALLSVEPNKKKQQLTLTGQAKTIGAALYYVEQLAQLPMLSQVYLQKHEVNLEDPFKPVNFIIVARWS